MSYLNVITLAEAKNHLRIDEDFTEDDAAIERMIISALQLIETNTNHIMYQQQKTYYKSVGSDRIVVYDYPINDYDTDTIALHYSLRHEFKADKITLDVGYTSNDKVPSSLIEVAMMLIDNMYYEHENEGSAGEISNKADRMMFNYRRCIVS